MRHELLEYPVADLTLTSFTLHLFPETGGISRTSVRTIHTELDDGSAIEHEANTDPVCTRALAAKANPWPM
jgi:hypothetical protein